MSGEESTAVSFCIAGLGPGEMPVARIVVPLNGAGPLAEQILAVVFGNQSGVDAAVERFRSYQNDPKEPK